MMLKTGVAVLVAVLASACAQKPQQDVADLVVMGAAIDTMNPAQPQARALAVRNGKIAYVGDEENAQKWIGKDTRVLRLAGVTVLPGLIDSHIHVMEGALSLDACTFADAQLTVDKIAPVINDCAKRNPGEGWLVVQNLNAAGFHATRKDLDAIIPSRPLLLWAADGHVGWANSAALTRAGIDAKTPDPVDGRIERDSKGVPTGFLVDGAMGLVSSLLDKPTPETRERLLVRALHDLAADGITTFMEANTSAETVNTYVDLARKKQLTSRVTFALGSDGASTDEEFKRLKALRQLAESQPPMRADMIKLFADGIMEFPTQSAAMLEPYLNADGKPGTDRGPLYHEPGPLNAFVRRAADEGFGVHIHAIGDRAVRVALDAFADARSHGSKRLYSIAHLELVDPKDIPRFRELDVIPSLQLQWAQPDNYSVDAVLRYIGPERQARLYPARAFVAAGATIAGGSDWNVSTFNPFEAIAVATSRTNPQQPQRGVLGADQILTLRDMLPAYTINAARMIGREAEVGSLETGKAADIVVLDRHLDDSSTTADIRATRVVYTFTNGVMRIGPSGP
ncbi:MAG TPA: amidohydrolase [Steroidobacteraceae bacterium]|nr:amidohydrolase [Steroidobacteraceae bacterium]